jgi:hypothetical protein
MTTLPSVEESGNEPTGFVKVTRLAGKTATFDYVSGLTVADVLQQAGYDQAQNQDHQVLVNGRPARSLEDTLEPDSIVSIVGNNDNG